jgi:hypothetical protein
LDSQGAPPAVWSVQRPVSDEQVLSPVQALGPAIGSHGAPISEYGVQCCPFDPKTQSAPSTHWPAAVHAEPTGREGLQRPSSAELAQ